MGWSGVETRGEIFWQGKDLSKRPLGIEENDVKVERMYTGYNFSRSVSEWHWPWYCYPNSGFQKIEQLDPTVRNCRPVSVVGKDPNLRTFRIYQS
jgi:hypothetical protein